MEIDDNTLPARATETSVERTRAAGILGVAARLNLPHGTAERAIADGTSLEAFREFGIDATAARQAAIAPPLWNENRSASDPGGAYEAQHRSYAQPAEKLAPGIQAARCVVALAASRGDPRAAADYVSRHYGRAGEPVARSLATFSGSAGGFLVPPEMSSEVIELLRPESAVLGLNPTMVAMGAGNMSIPRIDQGSSATYVGELKVIPPSQPAFGMIQLSAKKLAAIVPISNDMIRYPSVSTDAIVRDDMVLSIAMAADLAFLRSPGTAYTPRGLRSFAAAPALNGANLIMAGYLVGSAYASTGQAQTIAALQTVTTDLARLELALENANIRLRRGGWIFSPRTKSYLMNIRDGLGNQIYYPEMSRGTLRGKPFKATTQVADNFLAVSSDGSTATTDGSEIYLADFAEVLIGEARGLEVEIFPGGSYVDSTGATVSGLSTDQTIIRAIVQHDLAMRQEAAVAVLTGARWF